MKNIKLIKFSALLVLAFVFGFVFTGVNVSAHTECEDCNSVTQEQVEQTLEDVYELLEEKGPVAVAQFEKAVLDFLAREDVQEALAFASEVAQEVYAALSNEVVLALGDLEVYVAGKVAEYDGQDAEYIVADVYAELQAALEALNAELAAAQEVAAPYLALAAEDLAAIYANLEENGFYVAEMLAYVENATNGVVTVENAIIALTHASHLVSIQADYVVEVLEAHKAEIEAEIDARIAELEAELADAKAQIEGKIAEVTPEVIAALEAAIAELEEAKADLDAYLAELKAEAIALHAEIVARLHELEAEVIAKVEEAVAEIEATVADIVAEIAALYEAATTATYVTTGDSYYVALGDSTASGNSYVDVLANDLFLANGMYENLAVEGMRLEDVLYLLNAEVAGDAYFNDKFADLSADYVAAVANADIITLGFNNVDFVSTQLGQLVPYALDWNRYFDADLVAVIEELLVELDDELAEVLGDFKSTVLTLISSYLYNYYGSIYHYAAVVEAIKAINPDAVVVSLSMYNPFQGLTVEVPNTDYVLAIGDYINGLIDVINGYHVLTGMVNEYTVSVSINGVETEYDAIVGANGLDTGIVELVSQFITNPEVFLPSEAGHAYIANAIYAQLTHSCAHVAALDDNDCTTALECVLCGAVLVEACEHTPVEIPAVPTSCSAPGYTAGSECSVCGMVLVEPTLVEALEHTYDNACDVYCNVCNASRTPAAHVYDNRCDETCNVCGGFRRVLGHVYGEWTVSKEATKKEEGQEYRECSECGHVEIRAIAKLQGTSAGAVVAIVGGSTVVAAAGGFSVVWFGVKKRSFADLKKIFKK